MHQFGSDALIVGVPGGEGRSAAVNPGDAVQVLLERRGRQAVTLNGMVLDLGVAQLGGTIKDQVSVVMRRVDAERYARLVPGWSVTILRELVPLPIP